jgi:hypothetical protein
MKNTNEIFGEWRQDLDESDISALNCFYCSGHVLLGFHNEITKTLKNFNKHNPLMGRDSLPKCFQI